MRRSKRVIPWWIYLAMAVLCFIVCSVAYQFAGQWVGALAPGEVGFGHTFLVNFLGVLRIALPLFFVVLGAVALFAPAPVPVARGKPAGGGNTTASDAGAAAAPAKPTFDTPSEVVGVNYGLLRCMEWRRFEIVCAEYLRCLNYEVMETGFGVKDAVDLEVFLPGKGELMSVVKCIAGARPVDAEAVRALLDAMKRRQVGEGMIFSVCGFTPRAERFAGRHRIALVGGETLCSRIRALEAETQAAMISVTTAGDYTTPTCPSCGVKLVLRRHSRSRPGRREFWGCMNHPRCRVTLPFR